MLVDGKFANAAVTAAFAAAAAEGVDYSMSRNGYRGYDGWADDADTDTGVLRHKPGDIQNVTVTADGTRGAVFAIESGTVIRMGWQNPAHHSGKRAGAGYRVTLQIDQTHQRMYGHLDPNSANVTYNQTITGGQYIGSYADPTNGHSDGPHVHDQLTEYDPVSGKYFPQSWQCFTNNGWPYHYTIWSV